MKVLLVYGTTEGQTQKIARFVADHLERGGHEVEMINAVDATSAIVLDKIDAVLVAASLHAGRYQSAIVHFVSDHLAFIRARPNAFLSVSLAAASDDEDDARGLEQCLANFTQQTGWMPRGTHHVAGAFRYTSYDFLKRWALKYIAFRKGGPVDASRDHELTDWADLARFIESFIRISERARPAAF